MKNTLKIIMGIIISILVFMIFVRVLSPEDDWICEKGQWTRHGNPSGPQPQEPCR